MSAVRFRPKAPSADVAHLAERHLAKVEVAGSNPVIRSIFVEPRKWSCLARKQGIFFLFN